MLAEQSAAHLASVRTRLNLSAQQVPAWNAYEDSVRALLADLARESPDAAAAGAVQRVDHRVDVARNRYAALENVADALRALHGQLSEEQRQIADHARPGTVPSISGGAFGPAPEGDAAERPARASGGRSQRPDRRQM